MTDNLTDRLAEIRARAEAATEGPWHWSGNTDVDTPSLSTWKPGLGRCTVLAIGREERTSTGRQADSIREYAEECGNDPDEMVEDWMTDGLGGTISDPVLWFYEDGWAVDAATRVVYEVAPNATTRDDPNVYRADIKDIRHPDAQFIAHARQDVPTLLAALEAVVAEHKALPNSTSALYPRPLCTCGKSWPCPTITAITDAMEVEG